MTVASDLLQQHIQTLVDDNARWQTLIRVRPGPWTHPYLISNPENERPLTRWHHAKRPPLKRVRSGPSRGPTMLG